MSVLIAGFARWHDRHPDARRVLRDIDSLIAQTALECYSALTRLPGEARADPALVARWLATNFPNHRFALSSEAQRELPATLAAAEVSGGATYDGLVALTAASAGATLVSLDRRAQSTYRRCGVSVELL